MIRIAIIDDSLAVCGHLEQLLQGFGQKYQQKIESEPYSSSTAFLEAIRKSEVFDLLFIDIELEQGRSGIEIADHIRNELGDELQQIVYISGKAGYSMALHHTHPLDFLIKPIQEEQIEKVMLRYLKMTGAWTDIFSYQSGGDTLKVKIGKIQYFSVRNKEIAMHTEEGITYFNGSLKDIRQQMESHGFMYIHRAFLVNPMYVQIFEYERVLLYDGTELPIGSSRRAEICRLRMHMLKQRRRL